MRCDTDVGLITHNLNGIKYNILERQINDCRPWPDDIDAENRVLRKAFAAHLRLVSDAMKAIEWVDSCDCSPPHEMEAIRAVLDLDAQEVRVVGRLRSS